MKKVVGIVIDDCYSIKAKFESADEHRVRRFSYSDLMDTLLLFLMMLKMGLTCLAYCSRVWSEVSFLKTGTEDVGVKVG